MGISARVRKPCCELEILLDVVVGINPSVKDIQPYEDFLSGFGKMLSSILYEEGNRFIKHHQITMGSTPCQYQRLEKYWQGNPNHPLMANISFMNFSDPRNYQ